MFPSAEEFGFPDELAAFALQYGHGVGLSIWEKPIFSRLISLPLKSCSSPASATGPSTARFLLPGMHSLTETVPCMACQGTARTQD